MEILGTGHNLLEKMDSDHGSQYSGFIQRGRLDAVSDLCTDFSVTSPFEEMEFVMDSSGALSSASSTGSCSSSCSSSSGEYMLFSEPGCHQDSPL